MKAKDEIASTHLSAKAQKDRYASAVHETAVRTLHEVFEADRAGKIQSVALTVGVNRVAPATGLPETVPLVQVAAGRDTFNAVRPRQRRRPWRRSSTSAPRCRRARSTCAPADTGRGVRQRQ